MDIGIVGRGRLGRSLAVLFERAGATVDLVGRERAPTAPVVLLAVPDRAIRQAAAALPEGPVVLHCSGTTGLDPVSSHPDHGSLHPLMTFPGPHALPNLEGVTGAIAGTDRALAEARRLALLLGMRPLEVPGDRRLYHAAAVLSGNFATVLLAEASRALQAAGVPEAVAPSVLAPLVLQSIRNAAEQGPREALTGPAARRDEKTLQGHRRALIEAGLDDVVPLYDLLTTTAQRVKFGDAPGD